MNGDFKKFWKTILHGQRGFFLKKIMRLPRKSSFLIFQIPKRFGFFDFRSDSSRVKIEKIHGERRFFSKKESVYRGEKRFFEMKTPPKTFDKSKTPPLPKNAKNAKNAEKEKILRSILEDFKKPENYAVFERLKDK